MHDHLNTLHSLASAPPARSHDEPRDDDQLFHFSESFKYTHTMSRTQQSHTIAFLIRKNEPFRTSVLLLLYEFDTRS